MRWRVRRATLLHVHVRPRRNDASVSILNRSFSTLLYVASAHWSLDAALWLRSAKLPCTQGFVCVCVSPKNAHTPWSWWARGTVQVDGCYEWRLLLENGARHRRVTHPHVREDPKHTIPYSMTQLGCARDARVSHWGVDGCGVRKSSQATTTPTCSLGTQAVYFTTGAQKERYADSSADVLHSPES